MSDDIDSKRQEDSVYYLVKDNSKKAVTKEQVKNLFLAEGKTVSEIANLVGVSEYRIQEIVDSENLPELRKTYAIEGLKKIQSSQVQNAQKLLNLENNFKKLRIIQLETELQSYLSYFERYGDFIKRHPTSGEILKDTNGIPMQITIPNVSREIAHLKESVLVSEGMQSILTKIEDLINTGKAKVKVDTSDYIDTDYTYLFEKSDT
ncbi:MAG: hypothetical protein MOGMAGMI_00356 [Candidatus Omnitrophica bacterium]|nr:hypothetical protein [Candidatus Omnitrophota bacterium]